MSSWADAFGTSWGDSWGATGQQQQTSGGSLDTIQDYVYLQAKREDEIIIAFVAAFTELIE